MISWQPHPDQHWARKVVELSQRGITLDALLDFYGKLGTASLMPHFSAALHTTNDVVRQAIIPASAAEARAHAEVLQGGPIRPDRMVTHIWAGLLSTLVAGVVSDALGETDYLLAAHLLKGDLDTLRNILLGQGVLKRAYWFAASP